MTTSEHQLALKCLEDITRRFSVWITDAKVLSMDDPAFRQAHVLRAQFDAVFGLLSIMDQNPDHRAAYEDQAGEFKRAQNLHKGNGASIIQTFQRSTA